METTQKLRILKGSAKYDICSSSNPRSDMHRSSSGLSRLALNSSNARSSGLGGIYQASTPRACAPKWQDSDPLWQTGATEHRRGCSSLFKVLLSNKCQHNCGYCQNASYSNVERTSLTPEELASTFIQLQQKRMVQGLFLSSAIEDTPEKTMAKIIKTAELVRYKYNFGGFIHLKIMPGVSTATIAQACKLANRASINIEAPTAAHLNCLSKTKNFADISRAVSIISQQIQKGRLSSGQTTQFVVGASEESDLDILKTSASLYHSSPMRRIYFSAFAPIEGTLLENVRRTEPLRQHRLYQCDFLMREYGFAFKELVFTPKGQLPLDADPKMNFALNHPELYPVEINSAPLNLLLKVPGIGPRSAERIVHLREQAHFNYIQGLKGLGLAIKRAKPFILINGKKQGVLKRSFKFNQLSFEFALN